MPRQEGTSPTAARLRRLLAQQRAPEGFTDSVMALVQAEGLSCAPPEPQAAGARGRTARIRWAHAWGVCAVALLLAAVRYTPSADEGRLAQLAPPDAERELAEVLQLAASKWLEAQDAAFPQRMDRHED